MKHKAIFIDVDGTLLTDSLEISPGTKEILSELHDSGVLIALVTARSPGASLPFYKELGIDKNPMVCFNGALIVQDNQIIYEEIISADDVLKIINEAKKFDINTSLYKHHDWYTDQVDYWINQEIQITNSVVTKIDFDELITPGFYVNKILCMGEAPEIDRAEIHLKSIGFINLNIHKSKPTYLEIMNNQASKSQGIEKIIAARQITKDEIIAIGDNFNDIDMFLYAGTSVAMGNAPGEVKKYATTITDTNNSDGIKKAITELLAIGY